MTKGKLFVISGPSGTGKGTICSEILDQRPSIRMSVSMTTRAPRPGEEEGKEYFFVSKDVFEDNIQQDGLIEYAQYCDNYYGTPREYVERQLEKGKDVILEIEIQGALKVKEKFPTALLMFVMPPNATELKKRLEGRGTESKEVIAKRLRRASEEAEGIEKYDFIVINDKLEECDRQMHSLIQAAHFTPDRNGEMIDNMRKELEELN